MLGSAGLREPSGLTKSLKGAEAFAGTLEVDSEEEEEVLPSCPWATHPAPSLVPGPDPVPVLDSDDGCFGVTMT